MSRKQLWLVVCMLTLAACTNPFAAEPTSTPAPTTPPEPTQARASPTPEAEATPTPAATSSPTPEEAQEAYETADCAFEEPAGVEVVCGYLSVPEDRNDPDGRNIRLHVATFRSTNPNPPPDPIVYLEGGPGGNPLEIIPLVFDDRFRPLLENRDLIIFDQRGTGYSEPALDCPELVDLAFELLDDDLSLEAANQLSLAAAQACYQRLAQEGIDLRAYNSAANAADLNDLRIALGYDEWNLYGISYGTRLALTAMRDFPQGIRSAILDSTYPPQVSQADLPANADRAFRVFFDGCATDPACNGAFPNLESMFYELVDRLDQQPAIERVTNPLTGETYDLLLNGESMIGVLFQSLYSSEVIPVLPKAIAAAHAGTDYGILARLAFNTVIQGEFTSQGMYYSVQCGEEVPFSTRDELAAADDPFPTLRGVFDGAPLYDLCQFWDAAPADPIENEPVRSGIPALVLAGEYDPVTPPAYGRMAAENLSASYFIEFPGMAHGVSTDGTCPRDIMLTFLDNPTAAPDVSCVDQLDGPAFVIPGAPIELTPFTNEQLGYTSVIPAGWEEIAPGIHIRSNVEEIAILQQALPGDRAMVLTLLATQFGLTSQPELSGTRSTSALEWDLYELELQELPADMALAQHDGMTYMVLMISDHVERDSLYETLFLPVLDAFVPE